MCHPFYKTFQFLGNNWREVVRLPFPFVFSSWTFVVKIFLDHGKNSRRSHQWCSIVCTSSIDTVDQNDLVQSTSGFSGRYPEVAVEFLLGSEEGDLLGFTHWCFGNVGRGAHIEVLC